MTVCFDNVIYDVLKLLLLIMMIFVSNSKIVHFIIFETQRHFGTCLVPQWCVCVIINAVWIIWHCSRDVWFKEEQAVKWVERHFEADLLTTALMAGSLHKIIWCLSPQWYQIQPLWVDFSNSIQIETQFLLSTLSSQASRSSQVYSLRGPTPSASH